MCGDHATRMHRTPMNCTLENNRQEILGHTYSTKIKRIKKKKEKNTELLLNWVLERYGHPTEARSYREKK